MADHNARSLTTQYLVNDKIIKQWDSLTLEQIAQQPYTFYEKGQKFVISYVIVDPDSDETDHFALKSNGSPTISLMYLSPNFKLVDTEMQVFDAFLSVNDEPLQRCSEFEWRAGTFSHMIAEKIQDQQVKRVKMNRIKHSS